MNIKYGDCLEETNGLAGERLEGLCTTRKN